jgi:hypothetical protein
MLRTNFYKKELLRYEKSIEEFKEKTGSKRLFIVPDAYDCHGQKLYDAMALHDYENSDLTEFWKIYDNMELEYGNTKTYLYDLDKDLLENLTKRTNRSKSQTQFLFQLVDGDFEKLKELEVKMKNCFFTGCPADKNAVEEVMKMTEKTDYFKL